MSQRVKVIKKLNTDPPHEGKADGDDGLFDNLIEEQVSEVIEEFDFLPGPNSEPPATASATAAGFAELHKLISDSFLLMHEKLQDLEATAKEMNDKIDQNEKNRLVGQKYILKRLDELEKWMKGGKSTDKVKTIVVDEDTDEGGGAAKRPKKAMPLSFPLKSFGEMELLAANAARYEKTKTGLVTLFTAARNTPHFIRNWIADDVLLEFSTILTFNKKNISESKFISMIKDTWVTGDYTAEDFDWAFDQILENIREERKTAASSEREKKK